jgi:hypothetical protein
MWLNGMAPFQLAWDRATAQDAQFKPRIMLPFSHDGTGKPVHFLGSGAGALIVVKKASTERVKELLGILNFLASPFGTQEQLLVRYGVKDVDFAFDDKGNPVLNQRGVQELYAPWANAVSPPPALYNPTSAEAPRVMYEAEKALLAMGLKNPVVGLYSPTDAQKSATRQSAIHGASIIPRNACVPSSASPAAISRIGGSATAPRTRSSVSPAAIVPHSAESHSISRAPERSRYAASSSRSPTIASRSSAGMSRESDDAKRGSSCMTSGAIEDRLVVAP